MVQGVLATGLAAASHGWTEAGAFFEDQFRMLHAHALVLHGIGGPAELVSPLRERAAALLASLEQLEAAIGEAGGAGQRLERPVKEVLDSLDAVAALLSLEDAGVGRARAV